MNDHQPTDEDHLELLQHATARHVSAAIENDEATALREGFLRLGQLVEVESAFDEEAFLTQLHSTTTPKPKLAPHHPWLLPAAIGAGIMAAAMLFFAFQDVLLLDVASELPQTVSNPGTASKEVPNPVASNSPSAFAPWHDLLDSRLAVASVQIRQIGFFPTRISNFGLLQEELNALQKDLDSSSL